MGRQTKINDATIVFDEVNRKILLANVKEIQRLNGVREDCHKAIAEVLKKGVDAGLDRKQIKALVARQNTPRADRDKFDREGRRYDDALGLAEQEQEQDLSSSSPARSTSPAREASPAREGNPAESLDPAIVGQDIETSIQPVRNDVGARTSDIKLDRSEPMSNSRHDPGRPAHQ